MSRPRSHAVLLRDTERLNERIRRAQISLDLLHAARRSLYLEARERPDPVPFAKIAAAAHTTEAAVMQVVKKGRAAAENGGT